MLIWVSMFEANEISTLPKRAAGIDVSYCQPKVDWTKVYDSGVRMVGIKATEGNNSVDSCLASHREGFRRLPFTLGVFYHFARTGDPTKQATRFVEKVGLLRPNERLCLDFEVLPVPERPEDNLPWIYEFMKVLMKTYVDRRPILYTSANHWQEIGNPDWPFASHIDLWAPRYSFHGEEPKPVKPWQAVGWTFWQYSDGGDTGQDVVTPGVGHCDVSWFHGDDAALTEYAKLTAQGVA